MRQIVLYGLVLGILLLTLQYAQYRFVLLRNAESVYTGFVAALCCGAGIWAGIALTRRFQRKTEAPPPENIASQTPFQPDPRTIERLNISPREYEVLQLIAQGLSNQEIANRLFLSPNTVKTHASNVFAKLDVQRRTQAIQKAQALGIL